MSARCLSQVEALIEASKVQSQHLNAIASNLPARLPRATYTSVAGATLAGGRNEADGPAAGASAGCQAELAVPCRDELALGPSQATASSGRRDCQQVALLVARLAHIEPGLPNMDALLVHAGTSGVLSAGTSQAGMGAAAGMGAGEEAGKRARGGAGGGGKDVPRWYVTQDEFDAVSAYMRGRLVPEKVRAARCAGAPGSLSGRGVIGVPYSLLGSHRVEGRRSRWRQQHDVPGRFLWRLGSGCVRAGGLMFNCRFWYVYPPAPLPLLPVQVNAALDELAGHGLATARLMAAVRAGGAKLAPAERKRATELMHSVAVRTGKRKRQGSVLDGWYAMVLRVGTDGSEGIHVRIPAGARFNALLPLTLRFLAALLSPNP